MVDQTKTELKVPSYVHQGHAAKQGSHKSKWGKNLYEVALNFFQFRIGVWRFLILASMGKISLDIAE